MDRFEQMRVFAAVVDAGSFVGAADALQMSKAAVSRHVSELEARLGVRLLHRTTRRLSLSAEGEQFHDRCRELLSELDDAEAEITSQSNEVSGVLRVNVPSSFGLMHLAPLWPRFLARHPRITLEVSLNDRQVNLVDEGFDLAVRIARLPSSSLISRSLARTRLILCASPRFLKTHGRPKHPSDLAALPVCAYTLFSMGESWPFIGPDGRSEEVRVTPSLRSNSGETCVMAALDGLGAVLQPSFIVGPMLRDGRLVELMPRYQSIPLGIYAVYPSRKHLANKVRRLIDFLVHELQHADWSE